MGGGVVTAEGNGRQKDVSWSEKLNTETLGGDRGGQKTEGQRRWGPAGRASV